MNQQPAQPQVSQSSGNSYSSRALLSRFSQPMINLLQMGKSGQSQSTQAAEDQLKQSPIGAIDNISETSSQPISTSEKLNIFEQVLDQVELDSIGQEMQAVEQPQVDPAQPVNYGTASRKEAPEGGFNSVLEQPVSIQYIEEEKAPELPLEVEKYIQEVQEDKDKAPKEIVIADDANNMADDNQYVAERVVVLPITPEIQTIGQRKSPKLSIRWLIEWSKKIIKIFEGKVIYRQVENN